MLTEKEKHEIEMGKKHVVFENENDFKPHPVLLIKEVSKLFGIYLRQNTEEGMRESRRMILFYLEKNEGACQQDIVKFSHLSAPAISTELVEMEREGFVCREKDEKDARHTRLCITEKGKEKNKEERKRFDLLANGVLSSLSLAEKEALYSVLYKVRGEILEKIKEERSEEK